MRAEDNEAWLAAAGQWAARHMRAERGAPVPDRVFIDLVDKRAGPDDNQAAEEWWRCRMAGNGNEQPMNQAAREALMAWRQQQLAQMAEQGRIHPDARLSVLQIRERQHLAELRRMAHGQ